MPRDSSGNYALPSPPSPFQNGTTADATQLMAVLDDMANAISGSLSADGSAPWAAAQNANNQHLTGLAPGVNPTDAVTIGQAAGLGAAFRNLLINGDFNVSQRGASFSLSSQAAFTADRWVVDAGNSTVAVGVNAQPHSLSMTRTATGSNGSAFYQRIEGVSSLAGQTATLSFLAAMTAPGTIAPSIRQHFGTGGSPAADRSVATSPVQVGVATQRVNVQVQVPAVDPATIGTNGDDYLEVRIDVPASLGNVTLTVDEVQFEAGNAPTPFERRPQSIEELLCKRYYSILGFDEAGYITTSTLLGATIGLATSMQRVPDTTIIKLVNSSNISGLNVTALGPSTAQVIGNGMSNAAYQVSGYFSASAEYAL